jgi:beta-xylosidase
MDPGGRRFLATRTYEGVHYNTGRETFLLPVTWRDGWPVILEHGRRDSVCRAWSEVHGGG